MQLERLENGILILEEPSVRRCLATLERNSTSQRQPNEMKLGEGGSGDETWPSGRRWSRGGLVRHPLREKKRRFGAFWVHADTQALSEFPLGKPLEAKLLKELIAVDFVSAMHRYSVLGGTCKKRHDDVWPAVCCVLYSLW